ncbi:MAG: hypothetical protein CHACPFDD_00472 [Phycisphaerae bacterium]|nr:hypothetical protein [Phycisphaerae bacterium]
MDLPRWLTDRQWLNLSRLPRFERRQIVIIVLFAIGLIAAGVLANLSCRLRHAARPSPRQAYGSATVVRVRSGDTLRIDRNDELLALAGIRAPGDDEPQCDESRRRCAELVLNQAITIAYDAQDRDADGRLVAYVDCNGVCVNSRLVEDGLAWVRLTPGTQRRSAELLAAQARARKARLGVWSLPPPDVEKSYELDPAGGLFHRTGCGAAGPAAQGASAVPREGVASRDACFERGAAPCPLCRP